MSDPTIASSAQREVPSSQAPAPAPAKMEYSNELTKFWEVGVKEDLAQLVKKYPFVTTIAMLATAFFGMMNIITFSPSCFIASVILLSLAATLAYATYHAVKGSPGNLFMHLWEAGSGAYGVFAWAISSGKAAVSY